MYCCEVESLINKKEAWIFDAPVRVIDHQFTARVDQINFIPVIFKGRSQRRTAEIGVPPLASIIAPGVAEENWIGQRSVRYSLWVEWSRGSEKHMNPV